MQLSLHAHYTRHTFFTTHPPLCEPLFDQAKRNFGAIFFDLTTRSGASLHAAHYMSLSRYTFALTTRVTTRTAKMGASGNFIFHPSLHTRSLTARSLHERAAADTRLTTRWSHCTSHYTLPTRPNSLHTHYTRPTRPHFTTRGRSLHVATILLCLATEAQGEIEYHYSNL